MLPILQIFDLENPQPSFWMLSFIHYFEYLFETFHSTGWRPSTPCLPCFFTFLILVSPWTAFWTISLELVSNSAFLSSAEYSLLFWRCSSVTQSCRTLRPHGLQPTRLLWPSLFLGHCSNSCPLSRWCHPIISSSVDSSSFPQSFPAPGSFPLSQLLVSGG